MIHYGLKLWSTNADLFEDAVTLHSRGAFDFIEMLANPDVPYDFSALAILKGIPVNIHAPNTREFHEFVIGDEQKKIWAKVVSLADFFHSKSIVVHPGRNHTARSFRQNLGYIDDARIYLENMPGRDTDGSIMFAQTFDELRELQEIKPFCFDFEKAVKAACEQGLDYHDYIESCLDILKPDYFHISGGDSKNPVDEHRDLSASNFDVKWMKQKADERNGSIVFETPKTNRLENDIANMDYFRNL